MNKDGTSYEGEYHDNHPNGYGVFIWDEGEKYEGYWLKGKYHG